MMSTTSFANVVNDVLDVPDGIMAEATATINEILANKTATKLNIIDLNTKMDNDKFQNNTKVMKILASSQNVKEAAAELIKQETKEQQQKQKQRKNSDNNKNDTESVPLTYNFEDTISYKSKYFGDSNVDINDRNKINHKDMENRIKEAKRRELFRLGGKTAETSMLFEKKFDDQYNDEIFYKKLRLNRLTLNARGHIDFDKTMGDRGRYGDGDGTWWDRFMVGTSFGIAFDNDEYVSQGHMPHRESSQTFRSDPSIGFKHTYAVERVQNLKDTGDLKEDDPDNKERRIPTYKSKRNVRLMKEAREKARLEREAKRTAEEVKEKVLVNDALNEFVLNQSNVAFKQKQKKTQQSQQQSRGKLGFKSSPPGPNKNENDDIGESSLAFEKSQILDPNRSTELKYFGKFARKQVFTHYHQLRKQRFHHHPDECTILGADMINDFDYEALSYQKYMKKNNKDQQQEEQEEQEEQELKSLSLSSSKMDDNDVNDNDDSLNKLMKNEGGKKMIVKETVNNHDHDHINNNGINDNNNSSCNSNNNDNDQKIAEEKEDQKIIKMKEIQNIESIEKALEKVNRTFMVTSPRTRYLNNCIYGRLPPIPNLIVRKEVGCKELNFALYGLGDTVMKSIVRCLHQLPEITSIDFSGNRLTDESIPLVIEELYKLKKLKELDLSGNDIDGDSSEALSEYLRSPSCKLHKICLAKADVDDEECDNFIQSVAENTHIREVDISNNLIGFSEIKNVVNPDFNTGGEAIADLLSMPTCPITTLNASWNLIRLESAAAIGRSLTINTSVTYLDLSYNGLGCAGAEAIGHALYDNQSLTTLNIANNSIPPRAAFVLSAALVQPSCQIIDLNLSGNPLGKVGGKAIMSIPTICGDNIKLTLKSCNFQLTDPTMAFDPEAPGGKYELALDVPYHKAIMETVLSLASRSEGMTIKSMKYKLDKDVREMKLKRIKTTPDAPFKNISYKDIEKMFNKYALRPAGLLGKEAVEDVLEIDADGIKNALAAFSFPKISMPEIIRLMITFDTDMSGQVELDEFAELIEYHKKSQLELIQEKAIMVEEGSKKAYRPGKEGTIILDIDYVPIQNDEFASNSEKTFSMLKLAGNIEDKALALEMGLGSLTLQTEQALNIYDEMMKETNDRIKTLMKLLPRLVNPVAARTLVDTVFGNDINMKKLLQREMKSGYGPIFGLATGHYDLDLKNEIDRSTFMKVMEINNTEIVKHRKEPYKKDTSQHGDWQNIRNFKFNDHAMVFDYLQFKTPRFSGTVSFDYVTPIRPREGQKAVKNSKLLNTMLDSGMITQAKYQNALHILETVRNKGPDLEGTNIGRNVGLALANLYNNPLPDGDLAEQLAKQDATYYPDELKYEPPPDYDNDPYDLDDLSSEEEEEEERLGKAEIMQKKRSGLENMKTNSLLSGSKKNDTSLSEKNETRSQKVKRLEKERIETDERLAKLAAEKAAEAYDNRDVIEKKEKKDGKKTAKSIFAFKGKFRTIGLLEAMKQSSKRGELTATVTRQQQELFDFICKRTVMSYQARFILERYPCLADLKKRKDRKKGGIREEKVNIAIYLYAKVYDLENYSVEIMTYFTPDEIALIVYRLGYLNVWSPLNPDGYIELGLDRREERMICKMMIHLGADEPGINWMYETFRWSRLEPMVPAWELTAMWLKEEGIPMKGTVTNLYYSGEGMNLKGCVPNKKLRLAMLTLTPIRVTKYLRDWAGVDEDWNPVEYLEKNMIDAGCNIDYGPSFTTM